MRLAVADSGPLHYLVLIGEIRILPALVSAVLIPPEVHEELSRVKTPEPVRSWIAHLPPWLQVQRAPSIDDDPALARLDPGERAAITLAVAIDADAILSDDRAGVAASRSRGIAAIGTLGLLQRAARRELLDLPAAIAQLAATNFHIRQDLIDLLLAEDRARRDGKEP